MVPPEGTLSVILRAGRDWETVRKLPCQRQICLRLLLYNYLWCRTKMLVTRKLFTKDDYIEDFQLG